VLNTTRTINVTSTGDLDCKAFAESVVNATQIYFPVSSSLNDSVICNSRRAQVTLYNPYPTTASEASGKLRIRGELLLLTLFTSCMGWVSHY
jgi:hypothetical protein